VLYLELYSSGLSTQEEHQGLGGQGLNCGDMAFGHIQL
jgi:hypothetical protein